MPRIVDEEDDNETRSLHSPSSALKWNLVGFWILGLCNNFAYVIMLSAAKDILTPSGDEPRNSTTACKEQITSRDCHPMSTGSVLLADILPSLLIKVSAPLFVHNIPFGIRHILVVLLQASSFLLVATGSSVNQGLIGVALASFGSGLGEISYLALASHFPVSVISAWSSGTGGAGIFGALVYAICTEHRLLNLTPKTTLLTMLVIPVLFCYTFWFIIRIPSTVHRVNVFDSSTYLVNRSYSRFHSRDNFDDDEAPLISEEVPRRSICPSGSISPLMKYMIPLILVYFAEYFINQGLLELFEFDCSHSFGLPVDSQYRWYQVLYQLGVFISRSSSNLIHIPTSFFPLLALLQLFNAVLFLINAIYMYIPHMIIVCFVIVLEGLLGGAAYVNTFKSIHKEIPSERKEFSMSFVSISDSLGIVMSGFLSIPVHNHICSLPL